MGQTIRGGTFWATAAPYDVTADGQRFLINTVVDTEPNAPLTVVVNNDYNYNSNCINRPAFEWWAGTCSAMDKNSRFLGVVQKRKRPS